MDGIAERTRTFANVIRVRIQDEEGRAVAERFGVTYTPSYLLFDAEGDVAGRPRVAEDALAERLRALARP